MATTAATRIDDEVFESARIVGEAMNRSASQQVTHWARIGRELEASASVSARRIASVLAGRTSYDDVDAESQAVVRAEWSERIDSRIAELDLVQVFTAQGRPYVELDEDGAVVTRGT